MFKKPMFLKGNIRPYRLKKPKINNLILKFILHEFIIINKI